MTACIQFERTLMMCLANGEGGESPAPTAPACIQCLFGAENILSAYPPSDFQNCADISNQVCSALIDLFRGTTVCPCAGVGCNNEIEAFFGCLQFDAFNECGSDLCCFSNTCPTQEPTKQPVPLPTPRPSEAPGRSPTPRPCEAPVRRPTPRPSEAPVRRPTPRPSEAPVRSPTLRPSMVPVKIPTQESAESSTKAPVRIPTPVPATTAPRPTNDLTPSNINGATQCELAPNIGTGTHNGSTTGLPVLQGGKSCRVPVTSAGVWFKIIGNGEIFQINTCGSSFDTRLIVYGTSCTALDCIDGSNNDGNCGKSSRVSWTTESNVSYYILVHGFDDSSGDFTLNVNAPNVPFVAPSSPKAVGIPTATTNIETSGSSLNKLGLVVIMMVWQVSRIFLQ